MIEKLKESVENKFGRKISYQKDCKALSSNVLDVTGEYLSPATLRRIFGFLLTNSNPSRVTLDILSRYLGLNDWDHFTNNNKQTPSNQYSIIDTWGRAQLKSKSISDHTLEYIKRKSGINFNQTVHRQFADEHIDHLIKSEFNATAFIGPGGYGKSTLLAKWYEKNIDKKKYSNDIVLFLQTITLDSLANSEVNFEDWLMRLLGISPENNFLNRISQSKENAPGKFIIIIDALDESTAQGAKLEKLLSSIADLSIKHTESSWFKIIVSARYYTWNKFRLYITNSNKWFNIEPDSFTFYGANIPLLTTNEIQKILDNTISTKNAGRILLEEFNFELRETLSYPYFLQLFINVYNPETEYLLHDQIEIFREFIKKQVYHTQYSEEKIDILNKIIELTEYGLNPNNVKKNTLKEIYPIHLKLAGNYFTAYEDLVSFGLIIEEEVESKYGGFSKIVQITNPSLYEILLAQILLEREGGVTFDLLKKIEKQYSGNEILISLIIRIFQFAYKDRVVEPLKKIFDLKRETVEGILSNPTIATTLRRDEYMRKILIPIYVKIPEVKKYLFETYPDYNNLLGSFTFCLTQFLNTSINPNDKLHANTLHTYAGFLSMDIGRIDRYYRQIESYTPKLEDHPNSIGRWFACKCMYSFLIDKTDPSHIINEALNYHKKLESLKNGQVYQFDNAFYPALIITNQFEVLENLTSNKTDLEENHQETKIKSLKLYNYLSKLSSGNQLTTNDTLDIERILSQLNPTDSFHPRILGLVLKASYYLNSNDIEKAYECFRYATELSNIAGYKIVEVKLLKNLSVVLSNLGEKTKSIECNKFAESLAEKTGFTFEIL